MAPTSKSARKAAKAPAKATPAKAAKRAAKDADQATTAAAKAEKAPAKTPAKKATKAATKAPARVIPALGRRPADPDRKPPPKRKGPLDKFLTQQLAALEAEREVYLRQAETLRAEADSLVDDREPGDVQFDEESGEGDTLAVERDFDLALSAQARQQVEEIDAALARIDEGTYGICRVSGLPIPKERLRAIPWATERVEYKVGGLGRR